jgi:predicted TIM-barrel fold metal-dependent hydrolase
MEDAGVGRQVLSPNHPPYLPDEAECVTAVKMLNDAYAEFAHRFPDRISSYVMLPLPHIDDSLKEIAYAFDTLDADGVVLLTNVDDVYLGDPRYEPLFAELDRRRAVVFLHPTSPACFEATSLGHPRPMLEFLLDTTRAVANLVLTGTLARHPEIRLIVPHAGAALPVIADRIAVFAELMPLGGLKAGAVDVIATLRRLYYEVGAGAPFPRHIKALLDLVDAGRLLYGTDFPFGALPGIEANAEALASSALLTPPQLDAVLHGTALTLFPRLAPARA